MSDVAHLPSVCAACKKAGSLEVFQLVRDGRLRWQERFRCDCGHAFEAGDVGLPSPGVRQTLMTQLGRVELWLDDAAGRPGARKVLTTLLAWSAAQVDEALEEVPVRLFEGTHAEVEFLAAGLEKVGAVGVRIERG